MRGGGYEQIERSGLFYSTQACHRLRTITASMKRSAHERGWPWPWNLLRRQLPSQHWSQILHVRILADYKCYIMNKQSRSISRPADIAFFRACSGDSLLHGRFLLTSSQKSCTRRRLMRLRKSGFLSAALVLETGAAASPLSFVCQFTTVEAALSSSAFRSLTHSVHGRISVLIPASWACS